MAQGEDSLGNKTRKMIYNHILVYPGVPFYILKRIFELTDGALRYHLEYLERVKLINSGLEKGNRCYYPNQNVVINAKNNPHSFELHNLTPQQQVVLREIKQNPGINQTELMKRTRLNRSRVSRSINTLSDLNLVRKKMMGKHTSYEYAPDEELQYKMLKRLVIRLLKGEIDEKKFLKLKKQLE